jgi:hypothetical protein
MYDYFVGELVCPGCGTVNGTTAYTNMQTHIRGACADGTELAVGFVLDPVEVTPGHLAGAGYVLISPPEELSSPRLLDVWICPACETEQWATIEIVQQRIERIVAVVLDNTTFESSNYIDDTHAELLAAALLGISWAELSERKLSCVEVLRERLS